ncbi:hypothetical protein [Mammaliicoccus sciuri]|uniref:hypothetical protein n=1 Tax=Mammaliicoccus sciuri TaxID=1296 RepID=UPI0034DD3BD6
MVKIKDGRTVEVGDKVILTKLNNWADHNALVSGHTPTVTITEVKSKTLGDREFYFEPTVEGVNYFAEITGDRFEFAAEREVEVGDKMILTSLSSPSRNDGNILDEGETPTVTVTDTFDKVTDDGSFAFEPRIKNMGYFSRSLGDKFEFADEVKQASDTVSFHNFARIDELCNGDIITVYHIYNSHGDMVTLSTPKTVKIKSTDGNYALLEEQVSGLIGLGPDDLFTIDVKANEGNDKDKVVYSGGHLLNQAFVEYRDKQHEQLAAIDGIEPYSPHKDKSINDKSNADQTGLAERILTNDFKAMQESDVFIFDVLNEGLGTIAEMGIVLGMKHQAQKVVDYIEQVEGEVGYLNEDEVELLEQQLAIINKPVLCYCSDIRQGNGHIPDHPDRFEYSTNQFLYGCVLSLTDGKGFISWEEVLDELERIGSQCN